MRHLWFLLSALVFWPHATFAQDWEGGRLHVTSDPEATSCRLFDPAGELVPIHVVHLYTPGSRGVRNFRVAEGPGVTMTYVSFSSPHTVVVGWDPHTEMSVAYPECLGGPVLVLTLYYIGQGTSETCSRIEVLPASGCVESLGCRPGDLWEVSVGNPGYFNPDGYNCGCLHIYPPPGPACAPVPTEHQTWGAIKSLYR